MSSLTVDVPQEMKAQLEDLARQTHRTESELARDALAGMLAQQSRIRTRIEAGLDEAERGVFASNDEVEAFFSQYAGE
jgi:predicted transcriptional regulator